MKPAPFDYHAPRQLKEAAELLASLPNAKILAGGQSLVPMMNFRYVMVDHLVDLGGVDDLRGIAVVDGKLRIGAMTRQRDLETSDEIARHCPLMTEALRHVGHRQTRNRGTIGGSLAHADPAAELPAVCAAYDAVIHVASVRGLRGAVPRFCLGLHGNRLGVRRNDRRGSNCRCGGRAVAMASVNSRAGMAILRSLEPRRCLTSAPAMSCGARRWRCAVSPPRRSALKRPKRG